MLCRIRCFFHGTCCDDTLRRCATGVILLTSHHRAHSYCPSSPPPPSPPPPPPRPLGNRSAEVCLCMCHAPQSTMSTGLIDTYRCDYIFVSLMVGLMNDLETRATVFSPSSGPRCITCLAAGRQIELHDTEMRTASALRPASQTTGLAAAELQRSIRPLRCASYTYRSIHGATPMCTGLRIHTHASVHC
jgi:hypothetical protein